MDSTDEIELARALGSASSASSPRRTTAAARRRPTLHQAAMAVATGAANYVVCYRTLNGRFRSPLQHGVSGDLITSDTIHYSWYMPSGLLTPRRGWRCSTAVMRTSSAPPPSSSGTSRSRSAIRGDQTSRILLPAPRSRWRSTSRRSGSSNRSGSTTCCQESDGAACCIVTTPERARDLKQKPALIRGVAQGSGVDQEAMTSFYRDDIGAIPEMDLVARQVWEISGLAPEDVDAAIIYDAFTAIVLWQLESSASAARRGAGVRGVGRDRARRTAADQHQRRTALEAYITA